jgi:GrpB-like predicted nucleotidyltransferase (UPF0157 family)
MTDEPVRIVEYDQAWPARFRAQQVHASAILAPWLAAPVEHIGSTSVPGLAAKPVIDMLGPVYSLAQAQDAVPALAADGWLLWPDDPCRHYRLWFLRPSPAARTHHLQLIEAADPHAQALLAFRDALRAEPRLGQEYRELKQGLAALHRGNRNAYANAKSDFIRRVLHSAGLQAPIRDPLPEQLTE